MGVLYGPSYCSNMEIETHGPAVTNVALGFVMVSPLMGLIIGLLGVWLIG